MDDLFTPTTALVVVDVQNDFADPDGALYVDHGEEVVEPVNRAVAAARDAGGVVAYTQDWHPPSTPHFAKDGGTWPVHCVRATWGAELHPALDTSGDVIVRKGTGGEDGYSAFSLHDPRTGESSPTGLWALLAARGVDDLVIAGLAADVCVLHTAVDAAELAREVRVIEDATLPVEQETGDHRRAVDTMLEVGVDLVAAA